MDFPENNYQAKYHPDLASLYSQVRRSLLILALTTALFIGSFWYFQNKSTVRTVLGTETVQTQP